jgi:hypothetical protein
MKQVFKTKFLTGSTLVSILKTGVYLMRFRTKKIVVYCENHTSLNVVLLHVQNAELLNAKARGKFSNFCGSKGQKTVFVFNGYVARKYRLCRSIHSK